MSAEILRQLSDGKAFKPAPSLWEMADAHVPFAELGFEPAPEPQVRRGLVEGTGLVIVSGESGSGKSTTLASVTASLAGELTAIGERRYLPVVVPVAGRAEATRNLDAFGQATIREVLAAIHDSLTPDQQKRLVRALGDAVTRQHTGARFNARAAATLFGLVEAGAGLQLGNDVVSVVGKDLLDGRGGLKTLGDICRSRGFELIVCIEDTDAWAQSDRAQDAQDFFSSVARPLANDVDIGVAIAVQNAWLEGPEVLDEVIAICERAVTVAAVPRPESEPHARRMVEQIIDRRIDLNIDEHAVGQYPAAALFSSEALDVLGHVLFKEGNVRAPLSKIRDVLDRHAEALPDKISEHHVLDVL